MNPLDSLDALQRLMLEVHERENDITLPDRENAVPIRYLHEAVERELLNRGYTFAHDKFDSQERTITRTYELNKVSRVCSGRYLIWEKKQSTISAPESNFKDPKAPKLWCIAIENDAERHSVRVYEKSDESVSEWLARVQKLDEKTSLGYTTLGYVN